MYVRMTGNHVSRAAAVLMLCMALLLLAGTGGAAPAVEPIKIGMLVSQTGFFSWYGEENLNGAALFAEELNAKGGIGGRPIELVVHNTETSPQQAVIGARKLIQEDRVVAIVGLGLISESAAVAPLVQNGPPTYSLSGAYAPDHRMMFAGTVFVGHTQQRALQFLAERNLKKVALLLTNDATGQIAERFLSANAPKAGVRITRIESFLPTDVDVTPQLNRIKGTQPDAIISWVVGRPLGVVLQGAKQLGITVPIVTSHGNLSPGFIQSISALQTGPLYVFGTKDLIWHHISLKDPQQKVVAGMQNKHLARFGKEGGIGTGTGHDALLILSEGIRRAGSTSPMAVVEAIEGIRNFVGVVGVYNFSRDDHRGLDAASAIPMVVEKGKLRPVFAVK
ncbi:MAG: ABC transporter substrate-binding protein [Armatimonadota bacterium]